MSIWEIAIKRPVTVSMVVFILLVLGVVSFGGLGIDLLPSINMPIAVVFTSHSGAGPQEIEALISKPIEEVMGTVNNAKKISSTSSSGTSMVMVEFVQGTDMNFAALQMREKVDMIKATLPSDASDPMIIQYDPSLIPVLETAISSSNKQTDLQNLVEKKIKPRLERLEGVAQVSIYGGYTREIKVDVIPERLEGYGLSLPQVISALKSESLSMPGGTITEGSYSYTVRTTADYTDISQINNLPIQSPRGKVALGEIANVSEGYKNMTSRTILGDEECITLLIQKQSGHNTVQVSNIINKELDKMRKEMDELTITNVFDQASFIKQSINSVQTSALLGGLLAILILFLFLSNFRSTLIIGIAIPLSVIFTFIMIYFSGITLNLMSMGGLALGIGMLVDNSIVVLESIFRYRELGYNRVEAAIKGTKEIAQAVTASTLTTIVVFLPIIFIRDNLAISMFREMALTVTYSLLASLVVALTLVPLMSAKYLSMNTKERRGIFKKFDEGFNALKVVYQKILTWSISHRKTIVFGSTGLLIGLMVLAVTILGFSYFPETDEGMFSVSIEMPTGTSLDETTNTLQGIVSKITDIAKNSNTPIEYIFVMAGGTGSMGDSAEASQGQLIGSFGPRTERKQSLNDLLDFIRSETVNKMPGVKVSVSAYSMMMGGGMSGGKPISVEISGEDLDVIRELSNQVVEAVKQVPGTREVTASIGNTIPEIQININRDKAGLYGASAVSIANTVQTALMGQTAAKLRVSGTELNIRVSYPEHERDSLALLEGLKIPTAAGFVSLTDVADITKENSPISISRSDQARRFTVSGDIKDRSPSLVFSEINSAISKIKVENGYEIRLGGDNDTINDTVNGFLIALLLAVLLVYAVMASQFEHYMHPFIIMFSLPLSFIGVSIGMLITGKSFSVPALTGLVVLVGIVVNNAIVLIDYINQLRDEGMDMHTAIQTAGPIRLRPILMTTLTTVLGLLPIALGLGEGSEQQAPLAITVIGGLTFSTLLTLVVIPVVYTIFEDLKDKLKGKRKKLKKKGIDEECIGESLS